jgi:predicted RNA-binding protein with RPS1 domain
MWVKGTVRNVVDFGAFVDIGLKEDGLVHISQFSKRYVRDPLRFLHVGDVVEARIVGIDRDRGRIALTLISEEPPKPEPGAAKPAGVARREGGPRTGQAARGRPSGPRPARKPPRPQPAAAQAGAGQPAAADGSAAAAPSAPRPASRPPRQDRTDHRPKDRSARRERPDRGRPRTEAPRIIVSKDTSQPEQPLGNDEKGRPKLRWAYYDADLDQDATAKDNP